MDMETKEPGSARATWAGSGSNNISDAEKWGSIAAGAGLALYGLTRRSPGGLGLALMGGLLVRRGATGHCDLYQAMNVNTASGSQDTRKALGGRRGSHVEETITVNKPASELYQFWRRLENLPRFMQHIESVDRVSDTVSKWRARGPGGAILEWNAETINEIPNQLIAWRSVEGSDVVSAGSVHFDEALGERGTRIRVRLQYSPRGGKVGVAVAKLLGRDAATEIREDLRRLKQLLEAGEVPTTTGQPRGE
jgi:uncharacterized membrane protein